MANVDQQHRVREATRIFLQLKQDPDNETLLQARDAFISRGEQERGTYFDVEKAWSMTGRSKRVPTRSALAWMLVLGVSAYFAYAPLRVLAMADVRTGYDHATVTLASGDLAVLDAASAISDRSDAKERRVEVLQGAAFFDVELGRDDLMVKIGEVTIRAAGTAFETTLIDGSVIVTVSNGQLQVQADGRTWRLSQGDQLNWPGTGAAEITEVAVVDVAAWRQDRLVIDGMTFAEVADVIDRRLPGQIHIVSPSLARARMYGGLDLRNPEAAIRNLAAAEGARIVSVLPAGIVVLP